MSQYLSFEFKKGGSADVGLVFSSAYYASTHSGASFGSRLAFKSKELAEYAAKQFIDIYADYCF